MRPQIIHHHLLDFPQIPWTRLRCVGHDDVLVAVALQYVTLSPNCRQGKKGTFLVRLDIRRKITVVGQFGIVLKE
jgi:hypothetical protein